MGRTQCRNLHWRTNFEKWNSAASCWLEEKLQAGCCQHFAVENRGKKKQYCECFLLFEIKFKIL